MAYFRFTHIALLFFYLSMGSGTIQGMDGQPEPVTPVFNEANRSLNDFFLLDEDQQGQGDRI